MSKKQNGGIQTKISESVQGIEFFMNTKSQLCVYCQKRVATSRDHIPPKNLFPKPRPSNLITVPACDECNLETSMDDEYFRMVTVMRDDAHNHPDAKKGWKKAYRSLQRSIKRGHASKILETFKQVEMYTQGGIYLGNRIAFTIDYPRVEIILKKILKGLIYWSKKVSLPLNYRTNVFVLEGFQEDFWNKPELTRYIEIALTQHPTVLGEDIFSYRYKYSDDDKFASVWLFEFYKHYPVIGFASPDITHNNTLHTASHAGG